ncbi:MAG: 50S ribosomal protein L15 [Actinomycetia bacterium]|nr:50S ribosomal protein L15 [Actinomycetes bacterium]
MKLCDIKPPKGTLKPKKRVGRGDGSGHGTTSGRGTKGQLCRSGGKTRIGFEGGQMPLQRRLPHLKGFKNTRKKVYNVLNVGDLERFDQDSVIDYDQLQKAGLLLKRNRMVKVLGDGDITKSITVKADCFSQSAKEKIEKAGGKAEVIKHV